MLLKPNMVVSGKECRRQASIEEVATATLRCLRRHVPAAIPGIVFLSGGQSDILATSHLNAINRLDQPKPWRISFSYGRALQDSSMEAWRGKHEHRQAAQQAFSHRAKCNSAATLGRYTGVLEGERPGAVAAAPRSEWHDD
jgi:fructose-bisphosphate aldolase class I